MRYKVFPIFCSPVSHSALFMQHTFQGVRVKKERRPQINWEAPRFIWSSERSYRVERTEIHFMRCKVKLSPLDTWAACIRLAKFCWKEPRARPPGCLRTECPDQTLRWNVCAWRYATFCLRHPNGRQDETERNEGKLRAGSCHARWFLWFPASTSPSSSINHGLQGLCEWVCAGFGFHFVLQQIGVMCGVCCT